MSDPAKAVDSGLNSFARNVFSQSGEDGILEEILERLPRRDHWAAEFGAWDGKYCSNTFNLVKNHGYSAVLIEGDGERFKTLQAHCREYPQCLPVRAMVGFGVEDNLDVLLRNTPIPNEFDLLSIDIDGNDYHVWDACRTYRPKVVIIEFNPTIPTAVDFVQPRDPATNQGGSLRALNRLAKSKLYELVATTKLNAIFVDQTYFKHFSLADNSPEALRADESAVTYIFNGYDGTVFVRGHGKMGWHGLPYDESRLQQLPRWLRQYPNHYAPWKRQFAKLYRSLRKRGIL